MARGDFKYIAVNHTFNSTNSMWETFFIVETAPGQEVVNTEGYLLINVRSVDLSNHRIIINGFNLSGFDIPLPPSNSDAWFTYMDRIQPGVLQSGPNRIQIERVGNDNFVVKDLVVNWRETD